MSNPFEKLKTLINKANTIFLLFGVLCLFYLNFVVTGNEDNYLGWAKAYYSPDWLPGSFVFDHWLGHRYIYENFFGFLLKYLSFETVVGIGRILASGALAYSLSKLFKQLKLTNLESLLIVVCFIFCGQSFFAREWIFIGVEPKVFAYPLIFLSITELLKGNRKGSILFLVAATYMHVLAAGWFFLYFICHLIWNKISFLELVKTLGLFFAGILPLVLYVAPTVFSGPSDVNGIHLNWIYVYFRIPHHAAPFVDGKLNWDLKQILAGIFFFILAILIQQKKGWPEDIKFFNKFNIIIPTFVFSFFIVGYFDSAGDFLKFRPFRGTSIFLFFVFIESALLLRTINVNDKIKTTATFTSIGLLTVLITFGLGENLQENYIEAYLKPSKLDIAWKEATDFSQDHTEKGAVFLTKGINLNITRSFSRMSNRDIFVLKKFVPIDKNKWYEWYQRLHVKVDNTEQMAVLKKRYKLDYFLTIPSRPGIGKVVFENSYYVIYHLKD